MLLKEVTSRLSPEGEAGVRQGTEGPEGLGDMMGSPKWADGWPLAVLVGTLGGARPWEDALGVEWRLPREPGKAALGLLPHVRCYWWCPGAFLQVGVADGGEGTLSPLYSEINSLVPL